MKLCVPSFQLDGVAFSPSQRKLFQIFNSIHKPTHTSRNYCATKLEVQPTMTILFHDTAVTQRQQTGIFTLYNMIFILLFQICLIHKNKMVQYYDKFISPYLYKNIIMVEISILSKLLKQNYYLYFGVFHEEYWLFPFLVYRNLQE